MTLTGDTIAAIATAPGRGGVAVIRVSGPDAFPIAERLTGRPPEVGRAVFARIRQSVSPLPNQPPRQSISPSPNQTIKQSNNQTILDSGLVLAFRAPHSYTGEDVVEFQCHGGSVTPRRVLEACFAAGARPARRGEFTQRAFLNGRLDYDQAESVLDLVDAKTSRAADAALEGLAGRKRRASRALYEEALALSTELEHALDIDEGELPADFLPSLDARLSAFLGRLADEIRRAREGRILNRGALVVLAGAPNAGKSSLMNALLETNRAIVSDVPGTTRDSIEEWLDLGGWPIRLVDTAGLRETGDRVEAEGVRRAEELVDRADVAVFLLPAGSEGPCPPAGAIVVTSKCDLARGENLNVSATTGEGLDELRQTIVARLEEQTAAGGEDASPDDTHLPVLLDVFRTLTDFRAAQPLASCDLVLVGNALRTAAEKLGELVGATYSSDLLDRLFSRFCVGK